MERDKGLLRVLSHSERVDLLKRAEAAEKRVAELEAKMTAVAIWEDCRRSDGRYQELAYVLGAILRTPPSTPDAT